MGGGEGGEEAERFLLDGGFGVGGGVVEAVEEHRNAVRREGLDDLVEVFDGDLVGVSVGEFGERSKDSLLKLNHGKVGGERI